MKHNIWSVNVSLHYTLTPDEPPTVSAHTETRPDSMKFSHILGLADTVEASPWDHLSDRERESKLKVSC